MPEEKIKDGYILIARKMLKSGIMDKPPLWAKLFLWMLLKANKTDGYQGLKVGEFETTAREMQEAMTHYVGYRKEEPTPKQIRVIYEGLAGGKAEGKAKGKEKMIEFAPLKGKRGLKITILNYEKYQNPKNYVGQSKPKAQNTNEGQSEKFTKSLCRAKLINNKKNKNNKNINKFIFPETVDFVVDFIFHIQETRPNLSPKITDTFLENSLKTVIDLIRLDGFEFEYIRDVMRFAVQDSFWRDNVFSLCPLRTVSENTGLKKFQNIANKYESEKRKQANPKKLNGNSRPEKNASACEEFYNEMMEECSDE